MPLRLRLLLAIAGALLASFLAGLWVTGWQAQRLVRTEVSAALENGRQQVVAAREDFHGTPPHDALERLVAGFDGSRHILAELRLHESNSVASHPAAPAIEPPGWFIRLAAPGLLPIDVPVAADAAVRLAPLPVSEIGERWNEARQLLGLLALFSVLAAAASFATVVWSLRPLRTLAGALAQVEHGGESQPLPGKGPPEIASLAQGFNRMQQALLVASHENRRLSVLLDRLAEEERAELARDLHDEIGPLLFGITALAAAARMQQDAGNPSAADGSLRSLESAAADLQRAVRGLLGRLRDSAPASTDLAASLRELAEFWRGIRPQTEFNVTVEQATEAAPEPAKAALFRVAQEGVSNAIRHGNPARVDIEVAHSANGVALSVQDDGAGGAPVLNAQGEGFGIVGMEERLHALGGTLEVKRGRGWRLRAWAPADQAAIP